MGWYETKIYRSAEPQIKETAAIILKDPYLMPPSPLFNIVFDFLAEGDPDNAKHFIEGMLEDIIWNVHNSIKQIGGTDFPIDLLLFWKQLVKSGSKDGYKYFDTEGEYPTGYHQCGRLAPICIYAWAVYDKATRELENRSEFLYVEELQKTIVNLSPEPGDRALRGEQ